MGRILKSLGLLKKGHTVEVRRAELVSEYVGQTGIKTNEALRRAQDGVLFIDEAYNLVTGFQDQYGLESLNTLVAVMENKREGLTVIMAGYQGEIDRLIGYNPGLPSRFARVFEFPDYSPEELIQIFRLMADEKGMTIDDDAVLVLSAILTRAYADRSETFGNARYVRKLVNSVKENVTTRVMQTTTPREEPSREQLNRITRADIPGVPEVGQTRGPAVRAEKRVPVSSLPAAYDKDAPRAAFALDSARLVGATVAMVNVRGSSGNGTGTGFVITPEGLMITCAHASRGWRRLRSF